MGLRFYTILLIPTFIIIIVLEPNIFSAHLQSFCWNCPRWLSTDLPDNSATIPSSVVPNTVPLLPASTASLCISLCINLSPLGLSPERLLPPALLTLGSVTLLKQRTKHSPLQEGYICFHFQKPEFLGPLPTLGWVGVASSLSSLLHSFHHISGACGSSHVYSELCVLFLSPGLIEDEICRAVFLCFPFFLLLCLRFAGEGWKCWLLQPRSHKKPTLFISEQFSICRCDDPNVKESFMI